MRDGVDAIQARASAMRCSLRRDAARGGGGKMAAARFVACVRVWIFVAPAALLLMTSPAWAQHYTSPDWGKIAGMLKAGGINSAGVRAELAKIEPPHSPTPPLQLVIALTSSEKAQLNDYSEQERPDILVYRRNADGLVSGEGQQINAGLFDPLGLVPLNQIATLSVSKPISASGPFHEVQVNWVAGAQNDHSGWSSEWDCTVESPGSTGATIAACTSTTRDLYRNHVLTPEEKTRLAPRSTTVRFIFMPRSAIFVREADLNTSLDWRDGDGPWHSQTVSAALDPVHRERARALFARGFDAFKMGDFLGARALMLAGRAIDPGNALAWFTLGEIARAENTQAPSYALRTSAANYYRHVIDLAPDSVEAIEAKGYLDTLS